MEQVMTAGFDELYTKYAKAIYRFAYLKTSSTEMAKDITAETFCRFFEYSKKHPYIENEKAFLYRIARNYLIDCYRKKETGGNLVELDVETIPSDEDILKNSLTRELYQEVRSAMRFLKKEYEDIILLHYVEELSVKEISFIHKTTENVTRVKIHRAITSLKKHVTLSENNF